MEDNLNNNSDNQSNSDEVNLHQVNELLEYVKNKKVRIYINKK
jgi:hypothetical protein